MSIVNAASKITTGEFRTPTDFTIVTGFHSVMSVLMTLLVGDIEVNILPIYNCGNIRNSTAVMPSNLIQRHNACKLREMMEV